MSFFLKLIVRCLKFVANFFGYDLSITKIKQNFPRRRRFGKNINVGCGNYVIDGFINLDIYTDHYQSKKESEFIE